jgi:hypothetical protein
VEDRQLRARGERASRVAGRALALLVPLAGTLVAERVPAADPPPPALPAAGAPPGAPSPAPPGVADGVAPAPAVDRNQVHREAVETFAQLDIDQDGRLEAVETMGLVPEVFAAADRDHDGKLSITEWVDARFAELEAAPPTQPPSAAPTPPLPAPAATEESHAPPG